MFSLCGTFLEVLVQTIGKGESGTFRTVGIVRTKFFFQFALVAADFRSLQMIVEQTDCLAVNVDITPQAAVVGIWVGDELLLLDRITAEHSQLQKTLSGRRRRYILIRPFGNNGAKTVSTKFMIDPKLLKTEDIYTELLHVSSDFLA